MECEGNCDWARRMFDGMRGVVWEASGARPEMDRPSRLFRAGEGFGRRVGARVFEERGCDGMTIHYIESKE